MRTTTFATDAAPGDRPSTGAMHRHRLTLVEAAERFDPEFAAAMSAWRNGQPIPERTSSPEPPRESVPPPEPAWHDPHWQAVVTSVVDYAEGILWSPTGRGALDWLRARGLEDDTIRWFRLGFIPIAKPTKVSLECLPDRSGHPSSIYVPRGVTIPWAAPKSWYEAGPDADGAEPERKWVGVNVRKLAEGDVFANLPDGVDKCHALRGSSRGYLYPYVDILPTQGELPMLLTEGEFDALIGWQELGPACHVGTVGSASIRNFRRPTLAAIARCPWLLLATDHDDAGVKAARAWREKFPHKARRVMLPFGGDLNEFFAGGGDPLTWLHEECRRLGIPWTLLTRPAPRLRSLLPARPHAWLADLLAYLNRRGVRIDGAIVRPRIAVGTITGRITYREHAIQTFPKADRLARLAPVVEGRMVLRADYGQIEPRILLSILRRRGLIGWEAGADLYRDLIAESAMTRDIAKVAVNKIINGGIPAPGATGRLAEFIAATERYRNEVAADARETGYITTLAGRRIYLEPGEDNHRGKAVNRVVQGTAADVFNRAVDGVHSAIQAEGLPAALMLLLYDEGWVECDPDIEAHARELIRREMEAAAGSLGLTIPVEFGD